MSENSTINFYENIKVLVVIVSGVVFALNLWSSKELTDVVVLTWVYIPSAALTLYGLVPLSKQFEKWYVRVFWLLMSDLAISIVSIVITSKYPSVVMTILVLIKLLNLIVVALYIMYTVVQSRKREIPKEQRVRNVTRQQLDKEDSKSRLRPSEKRGEYRDRVSYLVKNKIKKNFK